MARVATTKRGFGHFTWYGAVVEEEILHATKTVVRNVTRYAAEYARRNHPWQSRSGDLELGIFAAEPKIEGSVVRGVWGAPGPALYLELGTVKMPAYPFLKPAADATYRIAHFAGSIGKELHSGQGSG